MMLINNWFLQWLINQSIYQTMSVYLQVA